MKLNFFHLARRGAAVGRRRAIFRAGARSGVNGTTYLANNPFINIVVLKKKEKRFVKLNSERSDLMTEVINF